jgi:thymidylate synthase (FAD)
MTHSAKLIWITPDAENTIAYCARVSNPSNQTNHDTAPRLLQYCINHQHWSVFEMASMCVEINTTRSIAAQILRHRSFSFQEFSQRYAQVVGDPVIPELRLQDHKNRQNSIDVLEPSEELVVLKSQIADYFDEGMDLYHQLLDAGVAKECAREVLPMAAPTKLYMNGTIRSWLHYCDLRTSNGTQKEHAQIAAQVQDILYSELPNVCEAMWNINLS